MGLSRLICIDFSQLPLKYKPAPIFWQIYLNSELKKIYVPVYKWITWLEALKSLPRSSWSMSISKKGYSPTLKTRIEFMTKICILLILYCWWFGLFRNSFFSFCLKHNGGECNHFSLLTDYIHKRQKTLIRRSRLMIWPCRPIWRT